MNNQEIYKELSIIVENDNNTVFFRNDEELNLLKEWLNSENKPVQEVLSNDVSLKALLESCNRCNGVTDKKFGIGTGENRVMIILNSPVLIGKVEKDIFKTESIGLLKKIINSINCNIKECYTTNLIKCDIENEFLQPSGIAKECKAILKKEIELVDPKVIIIMGDIVQLQSIIKKSSGIFWYNIEHPITLIKNPELKRSAWTTLKMVKEKIVEL